jgi:alanyl-tRNA synthetase
MTDRIYYTDAYAREFEAHVVGSVDIDGRPAVLLDRTAFYPSSGGQPFDLGTLGDARVVDVIDRDDGTIAHVIDGRAAGTVTGRIDWERRFDHMQQHTGQHVLSAAFDQATSARTVSFHLGADRSTIDLSRDLSANEIARGELEANRIVWENRPVSVRFVSDAEAASLQLRKEPKRTGTLRVVEVEGFDRSACGGTHVRATGEIGLIAITSWEKYKGGVRLEFVCGARALSAFNALRDNMAATIRQLSVLPTELPDAIARLQAESRDLQKRLRSNQERLAGFEAGAIAERAESVGGMRLVLERADEWDANGLKALAVAIASHPGHAAVLLNGAAGLIAVARAADVPVDASAVLKQLTAAFGGRGGGRPDFAQGGGLKGSADEILAAARRDIAAGTRTT